MFIKTLVFALVGLLLLGCGKKTEEEKLAEFKSSLRYKTYRLASEKTVSAAVTAYNTKTNPTLAMDTVSAHSILGVLWFMQQQGRFCYIEADILDGIQGEGNSKLPSCLHILALYNMGFEQLSASQYQTLKEDLASDTEKTPEEIELEHKLLLSSLVLVGLQQRDSAMARFAAETLEATTQVDYLGPLVGAVAEAQDGHPVKACKQLRELVQSGRFTEHVRDLMTEAAQVIEKSDANNKKQIAREVAEAVGARLIQQIVDDIFTDEDQKAMLDSIRKLPEKINTPSQSIE